MDIGSRRLLKTGGNKGMEGINWKIMQIKRILGKPEFDTGLLPPLALMELEEAASNITGLGALILFGSIVRGEASRKSDIDLLMITMDHFDADKIRKELLMITRKIEHKNDLDVSFSIIDSDSVDDPYFSWELARDGMLIFCRPELVLRSKGGLSAYSLISYSYSGLKEKDKKAARRFIYESRNGLRVDKKNRLEFIAPGVILLPVDKGVVAEKKFKELGMKYGLLKIWI